jgi:adenosylmethionine---8-amino-7-oxononanoate aminotransferase
VLMAGVTHDAAEQLSEKLRQVLPAGLTHVFFSDDGSTAVEVALKMAVQYWSNSGRCEKRELVALEHAYHGDTVGAMSVSGDSAFTAPFQGMRFAVQRVHSAYCYRCPVGLKRESCHIECVQRLERLLAERHAQIAAVIIEPLLQGAGGMIVHPVEFLQKVRELCRRFDVLLIADEVLTGFGRCGKMFASQLAEITPDLMCLSKGITGGMLAMGATVCTDRIQKAFAGQDREHTFFHGHSYTGNPLACAAASASLEVFDHEPVFDRIHAIEKMHRERLEAIKLIPTVGDVRWIGSVAAIELDAKDAGYLSAVRPRLYGFFVDHGVLLRPLGNVIYILPPYVIAPNELHYVYDVVEKAIHELGPGRLA